mmetsp:Transcript_21911/g.74471  ORF Transcript_21911/g.74471 Transcript_21911/m.74471 type:complete len:534 (-) Transcript_21911:516-2117(-)
MAPVFKVPEVVDNDEGWGPPADAVPSCYADVPYAPFGKGDKLGRASDWSQGGYGKFGGRTYQSSTSGVNTVFNFFATDEESEFHLVDSRPMSRPKFGARRFQPSRFQRREQTTTQREQGAGAEREKLRRERQQQKKQSQWGYWNNRNWDNRVLYNSSVDIRPEWSVLEQIQLSSLTKLVHGSQKELPQAETLVSTGELGKWNKALDQLTPKTALALPRVRDAVMVSTTASDDPVLKRLAEQNPDATVFATDAVVAALMCSARSVYSWDVVVKKQGGKLYFDKRSNAALDSMTVNETAQDPMPDEKENINGIPSLSAEATSVNASFSHLAVGKGTKRSLGEPSPLPANGSAPPVGYNYKKWAVADGLVLVARTEQHVVVDGKDKSKLTAFVRAVNEFDSKVSGVDWRQKIETQRGAVLATELKNNAYKLARWTCQSILGGADQLKLGYVSRTHARDAANHEVLAAQTYKPNDFAQQINLSQPNMWGVFKFICDTCMKLNDGSYLLLKDPNKPVVRLYEVPNDAFEDDYADEPIA